MQRTSLTLLVFLLCLLASNANAQDWWPMFRHDLNHSGCSTSTGPDSNDMSWSFSTGDDVFFFSGRC
jgi:hypothetical protein